MTAKPIPLKIAEPPTKSDLLGLIDEVRKEIEAGECVALVLIPLFTDSRFAVRERGDISMAKLAGLLGRAWMDATNALDDE